MPEKDKAGVILSMYKTDLKLMLSVIDLHLREYSMLKEDSPGYNYIKLLKNLYRKLKKHV